MKAQTQLELLPTKPQVNSPKTGQLLKWIGNKHRFAKEIASYFPNAINVYREPFLGSGAVLGTLAPEKAVGSDCFNPLIEIWNLLRKEPEELKRQYAIRWDAMMSGNKVEGYERLKASYNAHPNGPDLLLLSRSCYGGVVRFRKIDGYMSTPCGIHEPISPNSFARRVDEWHRLTSGAVFKVQGFEEAMENCSNGDLVYCDPPYSHTQSILYGAQSFSLPELFRAIHDCKKRGARVALSIDGTKRSGETICDIPIPEGLFAREIMIHCGRSMLKRFQMDGKTLEEEVVHDRLLLTY
jgi:DNA adenine methylase